MGYRLQEFFDGVRLMLFAHFKVFPHTRHQLTGFNFFFTDDDAVRELKQFRVAYLLTDRFIGVVDG